MSKHQILIVEDNPDTRELLVEQLAELEQEVLEAANGQEAILRVGEQAPDVVIMDVMMPQLDGLETSRYLKLRFQDVFLPILVLSARSDRESREKGADYGCEDYRSKPYTKQQLLTSVEALLRLGTLENAARGSGLDARGRDELIDVRLELARRLITEQSLGIARRHVARILDLAPEHEDARALLEQLEAGA